YQNNELDLTTAGTAQLVQVRGNDGLREQFVGYSVLRTIGIYLNSEDPALSDARVRQALAGAIDREQYANVVLEGNAIPAYSWIPPGMPGHNPEIGQQYTDAIEESQQLLREAGAEDLELTLLLPDVSTTVLTGEWLQA